MSDYHWLYRVVGFGLPCNFGGVKIRGSAGGSMHDETELGMERVRMRKLAVVCLGIVLCLSLTAALAQTPPVGAPPVLPGIR
jgi:hypothetical protein